MSEHSLEDVPLTGQARLYVEFSSQAIKSALSQLSSLDLQLLRIVGEAGTIGTKALALETHLSRSAALSHAKKLTQSNLLIRKSAPSKTSGIKPMTKQIAELKSRIAEIENEKRSAERFDEDALRRMMESDES